MERERSPASAALALVAIALLGASFLTPWFTFDHSTGRQTPQGGFHDPAEDGVERQHYEAGPGGDDGDTQPSDAGQAKSVLATVRLLLAAAAACLALVALAAVPGIDRVLGRTATLALAAAGVVLAVAAATWFWVAFPQSFAARGVEGPFTDLLAGDGYTRTALAWGWAIAALAAPFAVTAFLVRFQAGSTDPALVVDVARGGQA